METEKLNENKCKEIVPYIGTPNEIINQSLPIQQPEIPIFYIQLPFWFSLDHDNPLITIDGISMDTYLFHSRRVVDNSYNAPFALFPENEYPS